MNLLCPNCQKMLTVPEQYAGQLMKCPLCAGTFTVPGLPSMAPPPVTPTASPPLETFGLKPEVAPSPAAAPLSTSTTTSPGTPTLPSASFSATPPPPPSMPGGPLTFSVWFKPEIVQWIAPGALVIAFFLMLFFPWIGVYPGGQAAAWQYAWGIPFGSYSEDPDLQKAPELHSYFHFTKADDVKEGREPRDNRPGFDALMLLYWPLFLLTLAVTVACALVPVLALKMPPAVQPFLQWRWALAAVLNLLCFLLLSLQLLWGFSLEQTVYAWRMEQPGVVELAKKDSRDTIEQKTLAAARGEASSLVKTTIYLKLTVFLLIVAILGAALTFGLERRRKPTPAHLDLVV